MTKYDIIENINEELGLSKKDIAKIVNMFFDEIKSEILLGNNVKISNFGSFEVKKREERVGRNPKTGQKAVISERFIVYFKPSKMLKHETNK